jgi:hypothetical protein
MKRSKFSLSNYKLLSMDLGELVPCGLTEVLPGDTIQQASSVLVRLAPLVSPVMHPLHVRIHHFYVPNRLIWEDFEDFITGGPDGNDSSVYPTITTPVSTGFAAGSLADYLGVPPGVDSFEVSALPFRAYNLIWNEFFRDQDIHSTPAAISTASGADTTTGTDLQVVSWERDYFTVARPWEQKGPAVTLPLGTSAPVQGIGPQNQSYNAGPTNAYETDGSGAESYASYTTGSNLIIEEDPNNAGFPNIRVDLSNATAATVIDLREALSLQRFAEARARYGSRYSEYLRYLGVRSSDARLQRPEYFGGGRQTIQFSEVLATAEGTNTEVGDLKGHGIGAMRSNRYRRYIEEHGWIVSLISTRPKSIYADGLQRHWSRRTKEDFHQKELEHIGQQEILNSEVRMAHADPDGVFGYGDRYDEYRHQWSSIAGEFRSTLNYWHMARTFASDPALNSDFIDCVPPDRIFADASSDTVYCMVNHSIQARRNLSRVANSFMR